MGKTHIVQGEIVECFGPQITLTTTEDVALESCNMSQLIGVERRAESVKVLVFRQTWVICTGKVVMDSHQIATGSYMGLAFDMVHNFWKIRQD